MSKIRLTKRQLRQIIKEAVDADGFDPAVGELADAMVQVFKESIRHSSDYELGVGSRIEDTGEHNDWRDVGPSNAEAEAQYDEQLERAAQALMDGILPVVRQVVESLRNGEI